MMLALPLLAFGLDSCRDPEPIVRPDIQIKGETGDFGATAELAFGAETGTKTATLTSNMAWTARESTIPAWATVNPQSGNSGERAISVTVSENDGTTSRSAEIEFYINDYTSLSVKLTVRQTAPGEPTQDDVLLFENFGTTASGNPTVAEFTGYSRLSPAGLDQSGVTYESNGGSIRTTSPPRSSEFSGAPVLFLNSDVAAAPTLYFIMGNIDIGDATQLIVRFGAGVIQEYPSLMAPDPNEIKLFAGFDGVSWAEVAYTSTPDNENDWYWVQAEFAVPAGTEKLYVKLQNTVRQARYDDFQVAKGGNGAVITPGTGPELTETTIPALNARMTPESQSAGNYFIKAIVTTNMADGNYSSNNLSVMAENATAEWNGIMLRGSGTNFFGTKEAPLFLAGEEIQVDLSNATLVQYRGTGAQDGDPYVNQVQIASVDAITKTGRTVTVNPVTITYDKIVEHQNMVVQIASAQSASAALTTWPSGNTTTPFTINDSSAMEFNVFTASASNIIGQAFLTGNGTIKGVAYVYGGSTSARSAAQLCPRTYDDVSGLTGARVGTSNYFEVSPDTTPVNVSNAAGTMTFTITANVPWTASSNNADFALNNTSGSGSGSVVVTYNANPNTVERSAVITFTTTDTSIPAADRTIAITIVQAPAAAAGTLLAYWNMAGIPNWGESPMAPTSATPAEVTVGGLTKHNFTTTGSPGANNWGGTDFSKNTEDVVLTNPDKYVTFTVSSTTKTVSLSSLVLTVRVTTTGPMKTSVQYKVGDGAYAEAGSFTFARPGSTTTFPAETIDFSGIAALQSVAANNEITIRIVPVAVEGTTTGNWYLTNGTSTTTHAVVLNGLTD